MKKILLGIVVFCFISILSVSSLNASETEQMALKNLVGDDEFARYLIDKETVFENEYTSIEDTSTQEEFEKIASSITIIEISASSYNIQDFSSLKYFTNVTALNLRYFDFSGNTNELYKSIPFLDLTGLTGLYLAGNQIEDISSLENLTNITNLYLAGNQIEDLSPLKDLTGLTGLYLDGNQIEDLSPLKDLTNLTELYLNGNQIEDLNPIKDLTNLTELYLDGNQIEDINVLSSLDSIRFFSFFGNKIIDISVLKSIDADNDSYLEHQKITAYLSESDVYDEIFKSVNSSSDNNFILDDYRLKLNFEQYKDKITEDDLKFGYYPNKYYEISSGLLGYIYNASITIVPSTFSADDFVTDRSDAAISEEQLFDQLKVEANEVDGNMDLIDEVRVVDNGDYDFDNPKVGEYEFTLRLGQVSSDLDTTVTYTVLNDPVLNIDNDTLYYSELGTEKELLKQLNIKLTDEYNKPHSSEDIDEIISSLSVVDFDNLHVGSNTVEVIYTGEHNKGDTTTFELTLLANPEIEMTDNEVTLSKAPENEEEILELLGVEINGSSDLPSEDVEIGYGSYDFSDPQPGVYEITVTYTYYADKFVTTTAYLTVEDDTEPTIDVDDDNEVKETGHNYNIVSILALIIMVIFLRFRKIK